MHYLVPDLLEPDLKLVFCGTAPSIASAQARAYYAKPGNIFWPTLHRTGFTPSLFAPQDYAALLDFGIGLTDLCKTMSGNDDELESAHLRPDLLWEKIARFKPGLLAFTSKNAARIALGKAVDYGVQEMVGNTRVYVCCSTSGRARRFWREELWTGLAGIYNTL